MPEEQAPYIPDDEPTEAAVLRAWAAEAESFADICHGLNDVGRSAVWMTRLNALRACMRAAGWDTGEGK